MPALPSKTAKPANAGALANAATGADPRAVAAAKVFYKRSNPQPGNPWGKLEDKAKWTKIATAALGAADLVDPLRLDGKATVTPQPATRGRPRKAMPEPTAIVPRRDRTGGSKLAGATATNAGGPMPVATKDGVGAAQTAAAAARQRQRLKQREAKV